MSFNAEFRGSLELVQSRLATPAPNNEVLEACGAVLASLGAEITETIESEFILLTEEAKPNAA